MRRPNAGLRGGKGQRGISLIIVMLILIVVTIVGIGGAQLALLGERSTRYDRDRLIAAQAAEAALKDAEADIAGIGDGSNNVATTRSAQFTAGNGGIFVAGCGTLGNTRGLCAPPADIDKPVWATVDFLDVSSSAPTVEFGTFTARTFPSGQGVEPELKPRYIIELIDDQDRGNDASASATPRPKMYRITAIGFGPRKEVQVVMQTAYRKKT